MRYFFNSVAFILALACVATVAFAQEGSSENMHSVGAVVIIFGLVCLSCGIALGARRHVRALLGHKKVKVRKADEGLSPFQ